MSYPHAACGGEKSSERRANVTAGSALRGEKFEVRASDHAQVTASDHAQRMEKKRRA